MEDTKCMPTPPKRVGREFVRQYYTIMNKSPENLHCFYSEEASFIHDDVDPAKRRTISVNGKMAIRDVMFERSPSYQHTSTRIATVDTIETLDDGLLVQINGEISYNEQPMRPFSQSFILIRKSPFQYFVQNDIFRFSDFEPDALNEPDHSTTIETAPAQDDWGTQCEEYIEPYENEAKNFTARADTSRDDIEAHVNEVKLDTSDSGLSSDAEKAIMDIQSQNLKSILQEPRSLTKESVMKHGPSPSSFVESEKMFETEIASASNDVSENHSQLFRDSCILTIGNVINPNISFEDGKREEFAANESDKTQESDDINVGKKNYRKKKDKRKARNEIKKERSCDEPVREMVEENYLPPEQQNSAVVLKEEPIVKSENYEQTPMVEQPTSSEDQVKVVGDQETPTCEPKTYADLAKTGRNEWIDELDRRRVSFEQNQRPPLLRRSSRTEKATPPADAGHSNRSSPKNDALQVFIGNIPRSATEEGIKKMFSRFGRLTRIRLHSNTRREYLPRYAFISYDNIQSVRQCLMKKHTFYWPENCPDGQKLNVNGDKSVDIWDDFGNRRSSEIQNRTREMRQFSKNFVLNSKDNKRSPDSDANISDSVKSERKGSSRA